jgi:hypothetical protein
LEGIPDQKPIECEMMGLVVITEKVVVGCTFGVGLILKTAQTDGLSDHTLKGILVRGEFGQNAEAAFAGFIKEKIGSIGPPMGWAPSSEDSIWKVFSMARFRAYMSESTPSRFNPRLLTGSM